MSPTSTHNLRCRQSIRNMVETDRVRVQRRGGRIVLGVGAVIGMVLAAAGALLPPTGNLSGNIVASVNGRAITVQELAFAHQRLVGDHPLPREERLELLNRLIDQELLIQRGVEIGLLDSDRSVRKALAMAMIDTIVAQVLAQNPTEAELRAFYDSHTAVFATPARVHVQAIFFAGAGDLGRARTQAERAAAAMANGLSFADARVHFGDPEAVLLPDAPLPINVLRRHLGPTLTEVALTMQPGEISFPLQSSAGYYLLRLVALQPERVQPYAAVKHTVRAEYFRRGRDDALQEYLDRLRAQATIVLSPKAVVESRVGQPSPAERKGRKKLWVSDAGL